MITISNILLKLYLSYSLLTSLQRIHLRQRLYTKIHVSLLHNYNKINVTDLQKPTICTQETHRIIIHISLWLNYNLRYVNKVVYMYARNTLNSQNHCRNKICCYVTCSHRGTKSEILIISFV